jgi:Na+/glutamate symporter
MIQFLFGLMIGFIVGYPLGLWAIDYTRRHNERQEHSRTNQ